MSKRTISLIIALFLVTVLLLGIALSNSPKTLPGKTISNSPAPTPYMQTNLAFSPSMITVPFGAIAPQTVKVMMSTSANQATGIQLELSYDPKALTNVSVATGTMFTNPLMFNNKVDAVNGKISFSYAITPSQQPQKGDGTVAIITFTPVRSPVDANGVRLTQTMIKFLPKTEVSARGVDQSVLTNSSFNNMFTVSFGSGATSVLPVSTTP